MVIIPLYDLNAYMILFDMDESDKFADVRVTWPSALPDSVTAQYRCLLGGDSRMVYAKHIRRVSFEEALFSLLPTSNAKPCSNFRVSTLFKTRKDVQNTTFGHFAFLENHFKQYS